MIDAINWAIAENGRKDSKYYNRLDTSKVAVMGHSCGGIQAVAVGDDPRLKLVVNWSGGLYTTPPTGAGAGSEILPKEQLDKLHTPVFYISGDSTDIAFANSNDDFKRITKVPALRAWKDGIGHGGTYTQPNGGEFGKVAVALLEWQFQGDQQAGKMFQGANCGLCQDSKWHVEKKGNQLTRMRHARWWVFLSAGVAALIWSSGAGAQSPGETRTLTEADCTAAKLGDSIPVSAIGEPVSGAWTLNAPRWRSAGQESFRLV